MTTGKDVLCAFSVRRLMITLIALLAGTSALASPQRLDHRGGQPLAYVGTANNTLTVIDTADNKITDTVSLSIPAEVIAVTPDAQHVYVGGENVNPVGSGTVVVLEASHLHSTVASIPLTYRPYAIVASPDGSKIYVTNAVADLTDVLVSTIDTATNSIVATVDIPALLPARQGTAISPDGSRLYVAIEGGLSPFGDLVDVNATNNSLQDYIGIPNALGQRFSSAVVSPDNSKVYANVLYYPPGIDLIAIVDPTTATVSTTIPSLVSLQIFSPDGRHLYGTGFPDTVLAGGIADLNPMTNTASTVIADLPGAELLAITPDGRHLYVTTSNNSVVVIDTAAKAISSTIDGVNGADAIAIVPPPSLVPALKNFKVANLEINAEQGRFELDSRLTLDIPNSGLNPVNQPVRLQIGPFITTIPAGSFRHRRDGYAFEGDIEGVHLSAELKEVGASSYAFNAKAEGVNFNGVTNPVQVSLNINTEGGGLAQVRAAIGRDRCAWIRDAHR
ncbi:MAG TPA: YncE family protein, partial [Steroidobacteraceae bacterium]